MKSGIASQTNRFEVYDEGKRLRGVVTVALPSLEIVTNEFRGAGVGGSINVPAPGVMTAQTGTVSVPKIYGDLIKFLELGTTRTLDLRADVILNNTETHAVEHVAERWVLKGPLTASNPGNIANASAGDASITIQIYYAKHWLDGEELLEWDVFNAIHKVNGVDLLSEMRTNLLL